MVTTTVVVSNPTDKDLLVIVEPWASEYTIKAKRKLWVMFVGPSAATVETEYDGNQLILALLNPAGTTFGVREAFPDETSGSSNTQ